MIEHMPTNEENDKNKSSEEMLSMIKRNYQRKLEARRQKIAEIELANPQKEAFDISLFSTMYNLRDANGKILDDERAIEDLKALYYIDYPEVNSLQSFAEIMNWLDQHSAG